VDDLAVDDGQETLAGVLLGARRLVPAVRTVAEPGSQHRVGEVLGAALRERHLDVRRSSLCVSLHRSDRGDVVRRDHRFADDLAVLGLVQGHEAVGYRRVLVRGGRGRRCSRRDRRVTDGRRCGAASGRSGGRRSTDHRGGNASGRDCENEQEGSGVFSAHVSKYSL